jgi:hypothetical protein
MEMIPSKIALSLTGSSWKWLHEESWTDEHRNFASKCSCFYNIGPQKTVWLSVGGKGRPMAAVAGFSRAGRWILEEQAKGGNLPPQRLLGAAQIQWEDAIFTTAWISLSMKMPEDNPPTENPVNWLIETIIQRLSPDCITVSGDIPQDYFEHFTVLKGLDPDPGKFSLSPIAIVRISCDDWDSYPTAASAKRDLGWVKKRTEREQKEAARLKQPRKSPLLIRVLSALSPMRRSRRESMIHPLTKYRGY